MMGPLYRTPPKAPHPLVGWFRNMYSHVEVDDSGRVWVPDWLIAPYPCPGASKLKLPEDPEAVLPYHDFFQAVDRAIEAREQAQKGWESLPGEWF